MQKLVAAVSAGILDGQAIVDLNYEEDKLVSVDFNLVATEDGEFVEVQSSGEEATFAGSQLDEMLALGRNGISALIGAQRAVLARIMVTPPDVHWPAYLVEVGLGLSLLAGALYLGTVRSRLRIEANKGT